MMNKTILMTATVLLILAVVIGAFGAHALKTKINGDMMLVYKTGVEYHFYHAIGLLFVGVLYSHIPSALMNWAALSLTIGIVLFSGSLYLMAVTGVKWLGAITPLGGLSFIFGWGLLLVAVWKKMPV